MKKENNATPSTEPSAFKVAAFSADPDNALLLKLFNGPGDKYTSVALHDTSRQSGKEDLLNIIEKLQDADISVTDFPSNSRNYLASIVPEIDDYFAVYEDAGFKTVVFVPVSENPDAYAAAKTMLTEYGNKPTYVIGYQATDTDRKDYSLSRTAAMRQFLSERRNAGFNIIEFEIPRLSPTILKAAADNKLGYLSEELISMLSMTDKMWTRDAIRKYIQLFKEIGLVAGQRVNLLVQSPKGGIGKTITSGKIISILRRLDFKALLSN